MFLQNLLWEDKNKFWPQNKVGNTWRPIYHRTVGPRSLHPAPGVAPILVPECPDGPASPADASSRVLCLLRGAGAGKQETGLSLSDYVYLDL